MLVFTCKKVISTDIKQCKEIIEKRNLYVTLSFNIYLAASIYVIFQHVFKPKPYETLQAKEAHCFVS